MLLLIILLRRHVLSPRETSKNAEISFHVGTLARLWPEKCFLKRGEKKKKEYMLHYVFQEFILIVAIPEITPERRILICL